MAATPRNYQLQTYKIKHGVNGTAYVIATTYADAEETFREQKDMAYTRISSIETIGQAGAAFVSKKVLLDD